MDEEKLKNVVILKDLPSNIAKEAYVFLKPNIKVKQKVENLSDSAREKWPGYIVKEAENVISSYLLKMERNNNSNKNLELDKMKRKYYKLKKFCIGLSIVCILNILLNFII